MECRRIRDVLLHAGEVRAHPQACLERARVLAVRTLKRHTARREGRFAHRGIEHATNLGIARVAARGQDHSATGPDVQYLAPLVDIAVLPVALEQLARLGVASRCMVRPDAEDAARERLFANQLVETAVQHELNALLSRGELERSRKRDAVRYGVGRDEAARVVHLHWRERARALGIGHTGVLGRDRAGLDVGLVAEHEETARTARARQAASAMCAVDPGEADIVVHEELPRRRTVLGPGPDELALIVAVRVLGSEVEDRPVGDVGEEQLDVVVELLGILDGSDGDVTVLVALALHVSLLDRIAAAERDERPAVQHPAAEVEILVDDEHGRAEIARPNRRRQARAAAADDHDIGFVVPGDGLGARRSLRACLVRVEQGRGPDTGRSAGLDEIPPAEAALVAKLRIVSFFVAFFGHVRLPLMTITGYPEELHQVNRGCGCGQCRTCRTCRTSPNLVQREISLNGGYAPTAHETAAPG